MEIRNFLINNWDKITGFLLACFGLVLPIYKYLLEKRLEERDKRFSNYHKLIDELVGSPANTPMLDRQIAIIFELRNFKEYYPVSLRILKSLKQSWNSQNNSDITQRLIEEIQFTEDYIKSRSLFSIFR